VSRVLATGRYAATLARLGPTLGPGAKIFLTALTLGERNVSQLDAA
jgi:hypothetical protein